PCAGRLPRTLSCAHQTPLRRLDAARRRIAPDRACLDPRLFQPWVSLLIVDFVPVWACSIRDTRLSSRDWSQDACKPKERQQPDVSPTDIEFEPARLEARGSRVGVVIVVQLLAAQQDAERDDVVTGAFDSEIA